MIEVAAGDTTLSFSTPLAIIDFNATWCGPCQQFKPVFHKVAAKYADRITFFSVDTDSCPALAVQYQVQSIPQITAISADSVVANQIGSMSEADFTADRFILINRYSGAFPATGAHRFVVESALSGLRSVSLHYGYYIVMKADSAVKIRL